MSSKIKTERDTWIQTYTGKQFDPFNLKHEQICIEDIARALSMTCRWGGHVKQFYSVAEHSLLVSSLCFSNPLWGLLHDAAEAYIGDVPSPFKSNISNYRDIENDILRCILTKYGLEDYNWNGVMPPEVHKADKLLLVQEAAELKENPYWCSEHPKSNVLIQFLSPRQAEIAFLEKFYYLMSRR